jgi:Methyltransferase FkbM domain
MAKDRKQCPVALIVASGLLENAALGLVDVGVSGGIDERWRAFGKALRAVGFDLSITGCEKLNAAEVGREGRVEYVAQMVGGVRAPSAREGFNTYPFDRLHAHFVLREQARTMHDYFNELKPATFVPEFATNPPPAPVPDVVDLSACLRPRAEAWPPALQTLDDLLRERRFDADVIKIDTDGSDFAVLCGAQTALSQCPVLCVIIEANFAGHVAAAANTFANIDIYLRSLGFSLFDLEGPWRYARNDLPAPFLNPFPGPSATGQVIWADAIYLRDLAQPRYFSAFDVRIDLPKLAKLIAIAHLLGIPDFAVELAQRYRAGLSASLDVDQLVAALSAGGRHLQPSGAAGAG